MTRTRAPHHARVTCLAAAHLLRPDIRAAYNRCPDPAATTAGPAAHDRCPRDRSRQPRPAGIDEATTRHRLSVRRCAKASPYHGRSARPALGTASVTEPLVIGREGDRRSPKPFGRLTLDTRVISRLSAIGQNDSYARDALVVSFGDVGY